MKNLVIILFTLLCASQVNAQQDPQYTQYMYNMNIINPAYTGSTEGLAVGALYRSQWVGLDGGPETFTFNIHSPVGKRVGLGLSNHRRSNWPCKGNQCVCRFLLHNSSRNGDQISVWCEGWVYLS